MAAKRHHDGHHKGHYEGHDARRHQEMHDAGMIREDHNAIANMPQEVMIKHYPKDRDYLPDGLDDTIRGIDSQMDSDSPKRKGIFKPHKY